MIGKADIEHYEALLVRKTAFLLSGYDAETWEGLSHKTKNRWLDRSVDFLYGFLNDAAVVERLPMTIRSVKR